MLKTHVKSPSNQFNITNCIFFFLLFTSIFLQAEERKEYTQLNDGSIIIHTYDEEQTLLKEDIILRSGRHKITYFKESGIPEYGVVYTGTGSFGLMYYDEDEAPLFKFWNHSNTDSLIQFFSKEHREIGRIVFDIINDKRSIEFINFENEKGLITFKTLSIFLLTFFTGIITGYFISKSRKRVN